MRSKVFAMLWFRLVWGMCAVCSLCWGCQRERTPPTPSEPTLLEQAAALVRTARAEADPERAAALRLEAAQLTERSWRAGGRRQEAEAAVGLYRGLEGGPLACQGRLFAAVVQGEVEGSQEPARKAALALQDSTCRAAAKRILDVIGSSSVEPSDEVVSVPFSADAHLMPDAPVRVTQIERYGGVDAARVVVFLSAPLKYEAGALPPSSERGPRLYVDLTEAEYDGPRSYDVGGVVERVRVGRQDTGVRIVLDLRERVYQRVFYLPEPFRLVIDVSNEAPRLHAETGARQVRRVVLDPGHGGHDPGAIGVSGLQEKDVALDIAHRGAPLIARELGIDTLLTRDTDEFVPLDERVAKANAFGADLFISLHCNASESPASRGIMTFVLDASEDALAERVAARENAASAAASQHLAEILSQVMDAQSVARSAHFAGLLQRASVASLARGFGPVVDGGVRSAGFFVLAGARMPAVLFEASFISNPLEEQHLDTSRYRQKLADALVNAVRAYRDGL